MAEIFPRRVLLSGTIIPSVCINQNTNLITLYHTPDEIGNLTNNLRRRMIWIAFAMACVVKCDAYEGKDDADKHGPFWSLCTAWFNSHRVRINGVYHMVIIEHAEYDSNYTGNY